MGDNFLSALLRKRREMELGGGQGTGRDGGD